MDITWLAEAVTRRRGCLTLRELGKQLGVSASTLQRVEAGRMPTTPVYVKLCRWISDSGSFCAHTCEPGISYTLGGQTWVMTERWARAGGSQDGHDMLFRNKSAPQLARWVHPEEIRHLHQLGVVTVPSLKNGDTLPT